MIDAVPNDHREALEKAARLGYLARALVFFTIGYFAFRSAFAAGEIMNEREAIREIVSTPVGGVMLVLLVLALPSFAIWRFLQAFLDADGYGTDARGLATRAGRFLSGCIYLFLTIYAGSLLFGLSSASGEGGSAGVVEAWAPVFGPWFTIPIGIVLLGVAAAHLKKAWSGDFLRFLSLPPKHAGWMIRVCQAGLSARAIVFAALAILFFTSVARWSPEDTPGIQDALYQISTWPFGGPLLAATGVGLIAFAAYCLLLARFGHIRVPDLDPGQAMAKLRA
ncbi:DUF1206 domain-containing protein [Aureimonas mangrovi]|uniref:DUF1206 domain-containing protein n=1 Tax=Aureimonas mangrovi TaxID=2758041 RepID=UPI00163DC962|nr:DUF1206 domain-containing protein [Aureimonas mangrovi]